VTDSVGAASVLGLDIGGSHVRAHLRLADGALVEAEARGANPAAVGLEQTERQLAQVLRRLGNPEVASCCAGAAGAELPRFREGLSTALARLLPGCRISVVHDARLVLAAAGLEQGIAVIAGTGSVGYGLDAAGAERWAGGWGWMLGDEGGGSWLVREAARDLLRVTDEGGAPRPMGRALMRACGCESPRELRERLAGWRRPDQWAELAPAIFESAEVDTGARDLVARGATHLGGLARQVASSVGEAGPVVLAGGILAGQPLMNELVREALAAALPRAPVTTLDRAPVRGAVDLAAAMVV
jgi:N-acetylglucosamine kinase-like BadF-type ATPase